VFGKEIRFLSSSVVYARLNAHAHIKEITKMKNKIMSASSWLASLLFLAFFCLPASVVLGDEYDHKVK